MAHRGIAQVLQHIRNWAGVRASDQPNDGALLDRFIREQDEAAFAVLVQRYGSLVFGVCRRILRDSHDAEAAFQATFVVLVRKASSIHQRDSIASWLYRVAYRVALEAKSKAYRWRERAGDPNLQP